MAEQEGQFVAPTRRASPPPRPAPTGTPRPASRSCLLDQPGAGAWPITGATFILVYKQPANPAATGEVLKFFDWAYKNGDGMAGQLAYVPLPGAVKALVRHAWATVKGSAYKPRLQRRPTQPPGSRSPAAFRCTGDTRSCDGRHDRGDQLEAGVASARPLRARSSASSVLDRGDHCCWRPSPACWSRCSSAAGPPSPSSG